MRKDPKSDNSQDAKKLLRKFDNLGSERFCEYDVQRYLQDSRPEGSPPSPKEFLDEFNAFGFRERYIDKNSSYFGALYGGEMEDGTFWEFPSLNNIDADSINYWSNRAHEVVHPILRARYLGLVYEFSEKFLDSKPTFKVAKDYILSLLEIAAKNLHKYEVDIFRKLRKALEISVKFNNAELISKTKSTLIAYEESFIQENAAELWGHSFDLLVDNSKVELANEEELKIIQSLEERLSRHGIPKEASEDFDPWSAKAAGARLAKYHRKRNNNAEVDRIIGAISVAFEHIIKKAVPVQASAWMNDLYNLYIEFNQHKKAEGILLRIRDNSLKVHSGLKRVSHPVKITKEEFQKVREEVVVGDSNSYLGRIASYFIPEKDQTIKQVLALSEQNVFSFLITRKICDDQGRTVAIVEGIREDLNGHVVLQTSQNLSLSSIFLGNIFHYILNEKKLSLSEVEKFLYESPSFSPEKKNIIMKGVGAYIEGDHIACSHILIPQIESILRDVLDSSGGNTLKTRRADNGGFQLKTLDEILRDELLVKAFGEDMAFYLRVLLTDARGWNLRNRICHGLADSNIFTYVVADRIFHVLLCLGLIRHKSE